MEFETKYEIRIITVNDAERDRWSIGKGCTDAQFLCRVTYAVMEIKQEIDCTKVAIFDCNSEAEVFGQYLMDLQERTG
jgi:hypothetical protein